MRTVEISLPDELASKAANAGLLAPDAMESMLREQLRRRAGEELRAMWQQSPNEEMTAEDERDVEEAVAAARAKRRQRGAN